VIHIKVTARHAGQVAEKFGKFRGTKIMADEFKTHEDRVQKRLAKYPPERPKQRYRRTGRLGNAWTVTTRLTGNGATLAASNDTPYAKWVQDKPSQAWMHQGRWDTAQDIMASEETAIKTGIGRRATEALK
jgi:hypothetical protein